MTGLVCLGNLAVDDVVLEDGRTHLGLPGGAVLHAALGAALWGVPVAVVAPLGDDYPAPALDALSRRGVDLSALRPLGRPGLRTWLLYEDGVRRLVPRRSSVAHDVGSPTPADLAGRFPGAGAFHVAPSPLACQTALLEVLAHRDGATISVDPCEPLCEASLARWRAALGHADLLFASEEEMQLEDLRPLAGGRLRRVLLKHGARGGLCCDLASGEQRPWQPRARRVVDPTGAGDALAGGYLAGLLAGDTPERALARGLVSASFALEDWGAAGLLAATPAEARTRLDEWAVDSPPRR
jgi:sugar/nucleoside kinase (ribokinase family)